MTRRIFFMASTDMKLGTRINKRLNNLLLRPLWPEFHPERTVRCITRRIPQSILVMIVIFTALLPTLGIGASLKVTWNANTETDLSGYIVYYGTKSNTYEQADDIGKATSYQINNVQGGTYYYVSLTAYDSSGNESAKSGEKSIYIPYTITLVSPPDRATCSSNPTLTWTGSGFKSYRVFISITGGLIYNQVYSGSTTYTTLHPLLIWFFIPPFIPVTWYVEGTTLNGQIINSNTSSFTKK